MKIIRDGARAHIVGARNDLLYFYSEIPWSNVVQGLSAANALTPDEVGKRKRIAGVSYKVIGFGGTANIDLTRMPVTRAQHQSALLRWLFVPIGMLAKVFSLAAAPLRAARSKTIA